MPSWNSAMAPRTNWKGHLRLSLDSCPILLYPATSETETCRQSPRARSTEDKDRFSQMAPGWLDSADRAHSRRCLGSPIISTAIPT
jgi:hypothetical protein